MAPLAGTSSRVAAVAALVIGATALATPGWAQTIGYAGSVFGVRSTYEAQRADGMYFFNGVDVTTGPFRVAASVPLIRQRTTAIDSIVDPSLAVAPRTDSGFGDPLIRLDVRVIDNLDRNFQLGVAGAVKPGLVDAAGGLGTGVSDYAAGVSAFTAVGRTSVLADAMYWKYGDPDGVDFENVLSYSLGIGQILNNRWSTLVSFGGFTAVADAPPPLLLSVGVMALTGQGRSLTITAGFGLTSSSSDFSIGTSWRIQR